MPEEDNPHPPPTAVEFDTPINLEREGKVIILFPCDDAALREFVKARFSVEAPPGSGGWAGRCFASKALDAKTGSPTVVMGLRLWGPNPTDPTRAGSYQVAVLAHESFHVTELLLEKVGSSPPEDYGNEGVVWEDAAYLLQCIMRRALEALPAQGA